MDELTISALPSVPSLDEDGLGRSTSRQLFMFPSASTLSTTGSTTPRGRALPVFAAVVSLVWVTSCVSRPRSTEDIQGAHGLEELATIVASGEPRAVEGSRDVFSIEPASESAEELDDGESAAADTLAGEARIAEEFERRKLERATEDRVLTTPKRPPNPYRTFGERIVVHADGRITKPYPLPPGKGQRMLDLMKLMAGRGMFSVEVLDAATAAASDEEVIQAVLLNNWDAELYQDLRTYPPKDNEVAMADWLVCTATYELLEEVEYFIDLFGAGVPQIEIEAQVVELTETDVLDWGVPAADAVFPGNAFIESLGFALPNVESANEAILSLGAIQDGTTVSAIIQAVKTWENVSIISQPKIAVREGGKAEILNTEELPFFNVKSISDSGTFNATLDFKEVGVKLYVVPRILGSETLALNIDLEASQEAGSLTTVVAGTGAGAADLITPIIAKRSVKTIVYLKKDEALILGGLTTTRTREVERKVPFLGEIPLLGWLFKSRFTQVTKSHVLFFIRPRILEGTDFQREF